MRDRIRSESAPAARTHSLCFSFYKVTWNYYDAKISYWKPSSTIPANLIPLTPPFTWTHVCKDAVLVQWDTHGLVTTLDTKQDIPLAQWDTQDLETILDTKRNFYDTGWKSQLQDSAGTRVHRVIHLLLLASLTNVFIFSYKCTALAWCLPRAILFFKIIE